MLNKSFLDERFVKLNPDATNTVQIRTDSSCSMAEVRINGTLVMEGNYWDFHPGTHGFKFDFYGREDLAQKCETLIKNLGYKTKTKRNNYVYRE